MIKLNKKEVKYGYFPNGEIYLATKPLITNAFNRIIWEWEDNDDFIKLGLLKDYLDSIFGNTELHIKYFPYSRMDRQNGTYVFSLKYIARLINAMDFFAVIIREPHSDVLPALIDKCIIEEWCAVQAKKLVKQYEFDSIFFPDAGAQKRYGIDFPNAVGNKVRDFATGQIKSYTVTGTVGEKVLIVDDMCSRGGTFIEAAKKLRELGAKEVCLLVSYLEQNVLTGDMNRYIYYTFAGNTVPGYPTLIVLGDK
jgi:ribose-phosphate pyrophosphokinase